MWTFLMYIKVFNLDIGKVYFYYTVDYNTLYTWNELLSRTHHLSEKQNAHEGSNKKDLGMSAIVLCTVQTSTP